MRNIKRLLATLAVLGMPLMMSAGASATDCTISNTGDGSNNQCTNNTTYTCKVSTDNNVTITDNNGQQVASGTATVSGNTNSGGATTGTVTNSNGTTFNVSLTNGGCEVASVTPASTTPTKTPVSGMGATSAKPAAPKPTVLANTASINPAGIIATIAGLLAATAVAVRGYGLSLDRK